jgi:hypothetical protein
VIHGSDYGRAGAPGGAGGAPRFGNEPQLVLNMPNTAASNTKPNILFFMVVMFI